MKCRRPGLAEIACATTDRRSGQPDRCAARKIEVERRPGGGADRADCQKTEDAVLLAALEPAINHVLDLGKGDRAQRALETPGLAVAAFRGFPAEAVGNQHKAAGLAIVSEIADRDERVLYASGNNGKVFGILGAQPKLAVRRHRSEERRVGKEGRARRPAE